MLYVNDVYKTYHLKDRYGNKSTINAVKNVSFVLKENMSYALVGESGSGKSTLARLITSIEKVTSGEIILDQTPLNNLRPKKMQELRAKLQLVMQNAKGSLNPKHKVFDIIAEPLRNFNNMKMEDINKKVYELMEMVELSFETKDRYAHQLSDGQQKRVCIARTIAPNPQFIVFDEAVSGLDTTVRKKILDLLCRLRGELKATYLFITHDLDVALYMATDVFVMKDGMIVEHNSNAKSLSSFTHAYSRLLINSLPPVYPIQAVKNV